MWRAVKITNPRQTQSRDGMGNIVISAVPGIVIYQQVTPYTTREQLLVYRTENGWTAQLTGTEGKDVTDRLPQRAVGGIVLATTSAAGDDRTVRPAADAGDILMADEKTFTATEVEAAMCLWEAYIEFQSEIDPQTKLPTPFAERLCEMRSNVGSYVMRQAMTDLVEDCETAWEAATALDGDMHAFDFEFCPAFLRGAIEQGRLDNYAEQQWSAAAA